MADPNWEPFYTHLFKLHSHFFLVDKMPLLFVQYAYIQHDEYFFRIDRSFLLHLSDNAAFLTDTSSFARSGATAVNAEDSIGDIIFAIVDIASSVQYQRLSKKES
jgi:hypothetical protein